MSSREDIDRLFSRRTPSRRVDPPAPAAPAGAAPTAALPPPPPGYQYMYDQTHGRYVLVQVAIPGAPTPVANLVGPSGQPLTAGPAGTRSSQMLRPGVDAQGNSVDRYGEFLARVPDLDPRANPIAQQLYPHLVPDPEKVMQAFPPPRPIYERAPENADPAADAWGRSAPVTRAPGLSE